MIRIQNIYYMLAYAFQVLNQKGYREVATEEFENTADLCAEILIRGMQAQLKRGLNRLYVDKTEPLSAIRGKINFSESLKSSVYMRKQMVCSHDEFSINNASNRIIKATFLLLLRADIAKSRKKDIKKLLVYLSEVDEIDLATTNWSVTYNRNNQTYRMLISVCWLIVKGLLQTQSDGSTKLMAFFDEQRMCRLYEKFILEYYRKEHPELKVSSPYIDWSLDDEFTTLLPVMKSDITLERGNKVLIIDAKYYGHILQTRFDKETIHSGNLYQIFTYVKNKDAELRNLGYKASGMLLYAQTTEGIKLDATYRMSGNQISVKSLDLDLQFAEIRKQLDLIVDDNFTQSGI